MNPLILKMSMHTIVGHVMTNAVIDNPDVSVLVAHDGEHSVEPYVKAIVALPDLLAAARELHRYHTDPEYRMQQEMHACEEMGGNVSYLEVLDDRLGAALARAEGGAA